MKSKRRRYRFKSGRLHITPSVVGAYLQFMRGKHAYHKAYTLPNGDFIVIDFNGYNKILGIEFVGNCIPTRLLRGLNAKQKES